MFGKIKDSSSSLIEWASPVIKILRCPIADEMKSVTKRFELGQKEWLN